MSVWLISGAAFGAMFVLMALGLPIAFAMLIIGIAGMALLLGPGPALGMLGQVPYNSTTSYELSVVPMFVLMGVLVSHAGMSRDLYALFHGLLGRRRGGLAMATVLSSAGFSAVCGSSIATAATMGRLTIPEMRAYRYSPALAAGSVAAGGTLGILIPPSVILVLYGIQTSTDIGKLFIAGIIPGLVAVGLYIAAIMMTVRLDPEAAPLAAGSDQRGLGRAVMAVGPILALFVLIMGGLYWGVFTPTEGGGVGAAGALLFGLARRRLRLTQLGAALTETVRVTASLFLILIGALAFSNFMNQAGLPGALSRLVSDTGLPPVGVILIILLIYGVLGMFMESLSMVLLTVPIFFPIVAASGYDLIWFGIFAVMATELSLITPPVGMNLFIIRSVAPDISIGTLYRGILPFVLADIIRILLLIAVPAMALWLPGMMR